MPARVAIDLLDGTLGRQMSDLLRQIPAGVELGTGTARDLVVHGAPADQAWRLLNGQAGVGYVTAGKLMARKRPRLVPVYDQVVACLFGEPEDFWLGLHDRLALDDGALRRELVAAHGRAGLRAVVSPLRVLDVMLWMSHRGSHRPGRSCTGFRTVALR